MLIKDNFLDRLYTFLIVQVPTCDHITIAKSRFIQAIEKY